jgi:PTH2 family peptidyl-tRNA hydrolase
MTRNIKQVIVIRKDLEMLRGKEIAQGSHASNGPLCELILKSWKQNTPVLLSEAELLWLQGSQTIVCLSVNSEDELHQIAQSAEDAGLRHTLILDEGRTQFGGVHTYTALSIGPDYEDNINPITGHLKLHVDSRKDKKKQVKGEIKGDLIYLPSNTERVSNLINAFIRDHSSKTFEEILSGRQRVLIYPRDERNPFRVGDTIKIRELTEFKTLTGREINSVVTYVTGDTEKQMLGIEDNIEFLSISVVNHTETTFDKEF